MSCPDPHMLAAGKSSGLGCTSDMSKKQEKVGKPTDVHEKWRLNLVLTLLSRRNKRPGLFISLEAASRIRG